MPITDLPSNVVKRLEDTLHLSQNAGTPAEAEAAALALQRMLHKYQLTQAEVAQSRSGRVDPQTSASSAMSNVMVHLDGEDHTKLLWIEVLGATVANLSSCRVLFGPQDMIFLGPTYQVTAAQALFLNLYHAGKHLVEQAQEDRRRDLARRNLPTGWAGYGPGNPKKVRRDWIKSWLLGYVVGIQRVTTQEQETFAKNNQALVVQGTQAVKEYEEFLFPRTKVHKVNHHDISLGAYQAGIVKGQEAGRASQSTKLDSSTAKRLRSGGD